MDYCKTEMVLLRAVRSTCVLKEDLMGFLMMEIEESRVTQDCLWQLKGLPIHDLEFIIFRVTLAFEILNCSILF